MSVACGPRKFLCQRACTRRHTPAAGESCWDCLVRGCVVLSGARPSISRADAHWCRDTPVSDVPVQHGHTHRRPSQPGPAPASPRRRMAARQELCGVIPACGERDGACASRVTTKAAAGARPPSPTTRRPPVALDSRRADTFARALARMSSPRREAIYASGPPVRPRM